MMKCGAIVLALVAVASAASASSGKPSLGEALSELKVPPPWLATVEVDFDTSQPWNKAWDRIEKLLETADPADRRKAIKLAYLYQSSGRAKYGYPAAVYFLAGEYAWALVEHLKLTERNCGAWMKVASCYLHFGEHAHALEALDEAARRLPEPPWRDYQHAQVLEAKGGVYADAGDPARARDAWQRAIQLYEASQVPANLRLLIPRGVERVRSRIELLDRVAFAKGRLRDGTYVGEAFGYSDTVRARVAIRDGRIADVQLEHQEKADLGAEEIIPQRVLAAQSVEVDGVTGATVTSGAIQSAIFKALKQAVGPEEREKR